MTEVLPVQHSQVHQLLCHQTRIFTVLAEQYFRLPLSYTNDQFVCSKMMYFCVKLPQATNYDCCKEVFELLEDYGRSKLNLNLNDNHVFCQFGGEIWRIPLIS